jgi:hypothetical protein
VSSLGSGKEPYCDEGLRITDIGMDERRKKIIDHRSSNAERKRKKLKGRMRGG